jgi:hypothetical protein
MRCGTYVCGWLIASLILAIPAPAMAGAPGTWTRVTGQEADFELNLVRHRDRLHIGVRETESASTYRMIHRSISAGGAVGPSHTVAQGFPYLGTYPAFVAAGQLSMNFGAFAPGNPSGHDDTYMLQVTSGDNGDTWSAPLDTLVTDGPAESPSHMDGTLGPGAAYFVWEGTLGIFAQRYIAPVADADHTSFNDVGGNNIDPSIGFDSATGRVWVAYLLFGGGVDGVYVREVDTTTGEPAGASALLPGSFDTFQGGRVISFQNGRVPMTQRSQGGVFVAYRHGYPSPNAVRLWRLGATGFRTVAAGRAIGEVAVAADPNGRIWVVWVRRNRINARRSNPAVTRWGKGVSVRTPRNTVGVTTVQADAQAKVVDVLAHSQQVGNSGFFHTQLEPGISFSATPRRFPRDTSQRIKFTTKDAGAPLANSRITVAGESCTTNAAGVCFLPVGPYSRRRGVRAKATHADYAPAKLRLRVTR